MLDLVMTTQFRKDLKRINKRGKDLSLLKDVLQTLREEQALEEKYRDHALTGNYIGFRECHIQPDWLLVYAINKEELNTVFGLRRALSSMPVSDVTEQLINQMLLTKNNVEFIDKIKKVLPNIK